MRRSRSVALAAVLLLAACGGGDQAGTDTEADAPAESPAAEATEAAAGPGPECVETDELTATDNEWDPACVVTSGTLTVSNLGKAPHTFTVTGAIDIMLEPGDSEEVDVTEAAEPEGETYFLCTIHPGMDGFFWVQ